MMKIAAVHEEVGVAASALWEVLRDFANPQLLVPTITRCNIIGEGPGAVRTVHSNRGRIICERLLQRDDDALCLQYEVTDAGAMPLDEIRRYRSTVTLTRIGDGRTSIKWIAEGEVDGPLEGVTAWCETLYRGAIQNLAANAAGAG